MSDAAVGDLRESLERLGLRPDQQLALLPEDGDAADAEIEHARERRFGAGRPPGAQNRKTRELRDYILRNFTDPASGLASSGLCSTLAASVLKARALASAIGCDVIEALEFMRRCSEGVMPYVHGKQPIDVKLRGAVAQLNIGLGAGGERLSGDAVAMILDEFVRGALPAIEDLSDLEKDDGSST